MFYKAYCSAKHFKMIYFVLPTFGSNNTRLCTCVTGKNTCQSSSGGQVWVPVCEARGLVIRVTAKEGHT